MSMPEVKEQRRATVEQIRGVDAATRTVDVVASTYDLDSYGTRIDPNGWDFTQFKRNPVVTWAHDDRGVTMSGGMPIANVLPDSIRVVNGQVLMRLQFPAEGVFPVADQVFALVKEGFLRAVSVGFDPVEWEDVTETDAEGENAVVRVYRKQRLLELAVVTIPSNDAALVSRAKKLNADVNVVRGMTEQLEKMAGDDDKERQAQEEIVQYKPSHLLKCARYFDKKQPANKAATEVLKKFFKKHDEQQPDDEVKAWERMGEILEEPKPEPKTDEKTPVEKTEASTEEEIKEEPIPEPKKEEVKEEITPPSPPVQEAPEPERKASVQLSVGTLQKLGPALMKLYTNAAVEALRQGVLVKDLDGILDAVGKKAATSLVSH